MRFLMVSLLALSVAMPASADTLADAMADAIQSNPSLAAARQRVNATRETLPQAWAEALPQLSVGGSATASDRDADFALAYVKAHATTPSLQAQALGALSFKCDVLWSQLDALHHAYVNPGLPPPGAWTPGGENMA